MEALEHKSRTELVGGDQNRRNCSGTVCTAISQNKQTTQLVTRMQPNYSDDSLVNPIER